MTGADDDQNQEFACPPLALDPPSKYLVVCMPTLPSVDG
jgi:hypothetical protein